LKFLGGGENFVPPPRKISRVGKKFSDQNGFDHQKTLLEVFSGKKTVSSELWDGFCAK
jgi:hypothetical protein